MNCLIIKIWLFNFFDIINDNAMNILVPTSFRTISTGYIPSSSTTKKYKNLKF